MRKQLWKLLSFALAVVMLASTLTACGGSGENVNNGQVNENVEQTEFHVVSGISALSPGYENNEVLNKMPPSICPSVPRAMWAWAYGGRSTS